MRKNNGGPAFPGVTWITQGDNKNPEGMSLRDWFAAKAMQGLLAGLDTDAKLFMRSQKEPSETMAKASFNMADAMLAEREKDNG